MKAMILAAGRGERMGKLTTFKPKALLRVGGRYLIEFVIDRLVQAGICEIAINTSWHGRQIKEALGGGSYYGVTFHYSEEEERLETGGGILQALPWLGSDPFIVVSSDIISDYPLAHLQFEPEGLAHLVLVDNPSYHPNGDFGLQEGKVALQAKPALTFASMGVYRPELFAGCQSGYFPLIDVLNPAITKRQITGEHYQGLWYNIGTPQDIEDYNRRYTEKI